MVRVVPVQLDWLEALAESDAVFEQRFGIPVVAGWVGFPEAVPYAVREAREGDLGEWGSHLFFDDDGALVGFGGWKGAPIDGVAEVGYAVAPERQGRGIASEVVRQLIERARAAGLTMVCAHTLPEPNASTKVLERCGFAFAGDVTDPDEGTVWRWELALG
jgi:[ribosomal protein S5]-alanine N-acetyltransferase